ncbi:N-acetylglucosamine-6-phosphate deacetylase [Cereibacter azotoformans]|uniref:N-acetylglucosamine 6-phosphate deacetylase n=1 Tax=Cereibacter sphaeroides (strain ATCC 17025 / ATH 2.4.3) TaxID=349102 RepID=A4WW53_CERS5|nr:N-acetylglucosamine-6-phosphate deacetylase [Cereibacter azotoformans]ULB11119.1 N-acetylglucosamine-6-phosphate deacetylase [Cereibacter azotoformans]
MPLILRGARIFDGFSFREGALVLRDGQVAEILPPGAATVGPVEEIEGILAPGLIDLQVNGSGGVTLDGTATPATFARICDSQEALGVLHVLPTLITDRPEAVARVIEAARGAAGTPGLLGLHLEGPHLDPARKGAHDGSLIRPMQEADLALYLAAARALPRLMLTLSPAAASTRQIAALAAAGIVVSLGHTDCTMAEARAAFAAGAACVTHLFNAMSALGHREPGLPGAALTSAVPTGLIADGRHVAPEVIRIALAAKPEGLFLVSDCMAVAGTDLDEFELNGRRILRRDGQLTLASGTLAGADLTLPAAIRNLVRFGAPAERALAMATSAPARAIGRPELGRIAPGTHADLVLLTPGLRPTAIWRAGVRRDLPSRP